MVEVSEPVLELVLGVVLLAGLEKWEGVLVISFSG